MLEQAGVDTLEQSHHQNQEHQMARILRVGMIGLGSIGQDLVRLAREKAPEKIEFVGAIVKDLQKSGRMLPVTGSVDELMKHEPDVFLEVAGHDGLRSHGIQVLNNGLDLYFLAVGSLADPEFEAEFRAAAAASNGQARVVSGAIGALDAISGAAIGGLDRVQHTVRKHPQTLLGPEEGASITEPKEVFRGNAREAALAYPESVNVTAAVSFAGIGLDRTEVVVMVDPAVNRNVHTVEAEGTFGSLRFEIQNVPSAQNPKTGALVAMSALQQLLKIQQPIAVG
jgi:aspartate dehydrogenase